MSEPTITNTLDEEMLASTPDAVFLHSLVSIPYTVYGILTYSTSQLEAMIREVLTAIDQYVTAGSMANTRTTVDGDIPIRKIKTLSDLHSSKNSLVAKRAEAYVRIKNRLELIVEAYDNMYTNSPMTSKLWDKCLLRLRDYYQSEYNETLDRRYLVYLESLKSKSFVSPETPRLVTLTTTASTQPSVESASGPFSLSGESIIISIDGNPISVTLPSSPPATMTYTPPSGGYVVTGSMAPNVITSGYTSNSKYVDIGTCDVTGTTVTFLSGDPIGKGLATGDVIKLTVSPGVYSTAYVQSIIDATTVTVVGPFVYGPNFVGIPYAGIYRPELTVSVDGVSTTYNLDIDDNTAAEVVATLMAQAPTWSATVVGGEIYIEGPDAGATHSLMVSGRSAIPFGFPSDGGPNWRGTDGNGYVEFTVDGTNVTKTLSVGTYTSSTLASALSPLPSEPYTTADTGTALVISSLVNGPTSEIRWIEGFGEAQRWMYGSDVTVASVIDELVLAGVDAARGVQTAPTIIVRADESIQFSTNPLGFTTTTQYGTRTVVEYTGMETADTWESSQQYVWDGEYVQPPMPFSDSGDVAVHYGGVSTWETVYDYLDDMHNSTITVPKTAQKASLEKIKTFLNTFATGIGMYSKPVYPSIQFLLEGLEEGQYSRLVQELVVFDLAKAIDMALIGRKDLNYVAEILPSRRAEEGGTERGSFVAGITSISEDTTSDTYFDLEDDPMSLEFPDSLVRY